jgi:hypothetical protein
MMLEEEQQLELLQEREKAVRQLEVSNSNLIIWKYRNSVSRRVIAT